MVTLEQKLSLFSKLLQQEVQNEIGEKIKSLEDEYEGIKSEHKRRVDRDARHIVEHAEKKGEEKRLELISKARMYTKKQSVIAKEKYIKIFLQHLAKRFLDFSDTDDYKVYLTKLMGQLQETQKDVAYMIKMTPKDSEKYGEFVKEFLGQMGFKAITIQSDTPDLLGGMVIEEPVKRVRMDLSVQTLITEHKDEIVSLIFLAIGEVGESDEQ